MSDHKEEAEQALATLIHDYNEIHGKLTRMVAAGEGVGADGLAATFLPMIALAGSAQTHATLALAEQQRIANLIAIATAENDLLKALPEASPFATVFAQIREGLGLS